jgi:hypothetical protein
VIDLRHPLFDEIDESLASVVPPEPVELQGSWSEAARRTYSSAHQVGSGTGPFVDVIDLRWQGAFSSSVPVAGIAILVTDGELFWVKTEPAKLVLPVQISLQANANYSPALATLATLIGGSSLPGVPVPCGEDLRSVCTVRTAGLVTGRVEQVAAARGVAVAALLLPGRFLKVGRRRLFRFRDDMAVGLPPRVRGMLTRRRTGSVGSA